MNISAHELTSRITASWRTHAGRWLLASAAIALAACLLRPGWPVERARFDHVIVLDVTQSMDVQDESLNGKPVSRLNFAKHALREALLQLPCGSKVGWGVFTEYRAFLLFEPVEVCANLSELRATLEHIDGRMAWNGNSEIAKGLHSGLQVAKLLTGTPSLVFVTDGHESPPLSAQHRPAFDDKPGEVAGLIVGVGDVRPSPIPKSDPGGQPLGFWQADEVAQADLYSHGRSTSVNGERMTEDAVAAPTPALGATPGSEHLSGLREPYLRLLAGERGLGFVRLESADALAAALTAPALAKPTSVRADGRLLFAGLALILLLARYAAPLRRLPLWIGVLAALATPVARGNDRPFQVARTAVLEDDEQVWSFESWVQRLGSVRGLSVEPEYTFAAGTSVQVELTRLADRRGSETGHEAEVEFKQIFNNVARDGWGWGLSATVAAERTQDAGRTVPSIGVKLPLSIALGDGGGFVHLNAGVGKARDARRTWSGAMGIERELFKRTLFFAELAREGETTFMQLGARHWLRRDKLAIDFSLQQQRADGSRASGFIIGLGWYDL
ncbi:MAG: vWA domain-containing protein [Burkholderiales bacterium]